MMFASLASLTRVLCGLNVLRAYTLVMPRRFMMSTMRLLEVMTPLRSRRGFDLPGAVTLMAVAPDRVHVAGDRIHPLGFGMFGHPVVGGAGNARYPALR